MDAYKKYRQGLERAVQKLKEEREKQTTMEEMPRATRIKRKLEGRLPVASESGGESNRGPTPVAVERATPKPPKRVAAIGGPNREEGLPGGAAGPGQRDLEASLRWREELWQREGNGVPWLLGMDPGGPRPTDGRRYPEERWMDRMCSSPGSRERGRW